jgi:hypothetical protein
LALLWIKVDSIFSFSFFSFSGKTKLPVGTGKNSVSTGQKLPLALENTTCLQIKKNVGTRQTTHWYGTKTPAGTQRKHPLVLNRTIRRSSIRNKPPLDPEQNNPLARNEATRWLGIKALDVTGKIE